MKFTVIITNNTKYSIYVYICLFLRKFYSETNKSKQSWMLIQIQMYVRCGNRGHTVSTTIHGGNIFFFHITVEYATKFCIAKHFNLYNSWTTAINSLFWLYGTGWAMLHNNITKSDFLLAFFFICWKLDDVILLNKWRKRRKNSHFQNTE